MPSAELPNEFDVYHFAIVLVNDRNNSLVSYKQLVYLFLMPPAG